METQGKGGESNEGRGMEKNNRFHRKAGPRERLQQDEN